MKKNWGIFVKRILVTALTLALIGGSVDLSGFTVSAQTAQEEAAPGKAAQGESAQEKTAQGEAAQEKQTTVTVTGFAELPENIREQQLPVGAQESDIYLPESLTVTVEKTVMEDKGETDEEQSGTKGDSASQKEGGAAEGTGSGEQGESEGSTGSEGQGAAGDTGSGEQGGTEGSAGSEGQGAAGSTGSGEQGGTEGSAGSEGQGAAGDTGSGEQGGTEGNAGLEGQGRNGEAGNAAGQQDAAGQDNAAPENGNNSTDNGQNAGEQSGSGEGLVGRIADWLFAPMMVYAAENPAGEAAKADTEETTGNGDTSRTTEEVSLTGITWELDKEESDAEEFDAGEAANGFCYVYTPVLPDTDKDGNTLAVGDDVELPAIYVLVGEPQLAPLATWAVAKVTVDNGTTTTTTCTTVNAAIEAIQTAIKDNASGDTLDIELTFLADEIVTGLECTLEGSGKTNLTINMNGKTVGIDWENSPSTPPDNDFYLSMKDINATLTGNGTLSATVDIEEGAELTVKDEIAFQGTLKITDGGSCTITGGTYEQIHVNPGAKLEVSGDTAKIAKLCAYSPEENSTVKRAEIKLSGGTYNTISYPNGINQNYLEESTYRCAIVDMLASGYSFYDSSDSKIEKTPERKATELKDVKVLTEPEVVVSFQITKTDGTTQQKDFSTWNEAMSYLSDSGDETEFAGWKKVEILLKKDASISERVDPISDRLSAELVLRSEGDTIHTLSGTNPFSSLTALHINGQKLTVEKINLSNAYVKAVGGTVTIKNKADLKAAGGAIDVERSTLILENGASVSSMVDYNGHNGQIAIQMTDTAILRIKKGAVITGKVSDGGNQNGGIVVIEEGATLPSVAFWENSKVRVYCNLDSTAPSAWAAMKGGSVYFPIDCNGVTLTSSTDGAIKEYEGKIYGRYKMDGKIQVPDTVCSYQHAVGTTTSGDDTTFTMDGTITPVDADHTFTMPPAKVKLLKHTPNASGSCPNCGKTDLAEAYADGKLQINGLTGRTYDSWPQVMTGITLKGADGSTKTLNGPKYNDGRGLAQDSTDEANADLTDADYAVVYENNIKAYDKKPGASGFNAAKAPKVTITGQGAYTGTIEYYFTIGQGKLQMDGFEALQSVYNGPQDALQKYGTLTYEADGTDAAAHVPKAGQSDTSIPACTGKTVSADGFDSVDALKLEYSTDEGRIWTEIRQSSGDTSKASYQITNAGTYPFWIRATDENVSAPATQSLTATIEKRNMREVSVTFIWPGAWESDQPDSVMKRIFYFTGKPIVPDVGLVVRDYIGEHWFVLKKDEDYKIYATDNISDGQATLYVEGIGNYEGMRQKLFTIGFAFSLEQTSASSGHWYNKDVPAVFGVNDTSDNSDQILYRNKTYATGVGDNIMLYPTLEGAMNGTNEGYTYTEEGKNCQVLWGKDPVTGYISRTNPVWIWIDKTAPTWADKDGNTENYGIQVKENWWRKLLNTISFGMLYNDATLDIKIRANDKKNGLQDSCVSGIDKYYYYVDTVADAADKTAAKNKADLDELAAQGKFNEAALDSGLFDGEGATIHGQLGDGKHVVYAYAVDKAGNKSDYICTEGMVLDTTAPELTVTAPKQEEGTLQDTTATITVQSNEDATLMYIYTYYAARKMNSELGTYKEAVRLVEEYMDKKKDEVTRRPFAVRKDGKWVPDYSLSHLENDGTMYLVISGGSDDSDVAVRYGGCHELKAGEKSTFTIPNLSSELATKVWLVAIDKAGNITDTETLEFETTKQMPKITTLPQLSGVYGDTVDKLTLTPGAAKYYNGVDIVGTWNVVSTDSEKPEVGTTMQYTVKFTPDDTTLAEAYVKVTPTIAKRPINIWVEDMTKWYQESVPKLTFEIPTTADGKTQLADGDTKDTIQSSLHLVTEAEAGSDAGVYPFTVTSDSKNYEVTVMYVESLTDQTNPPKTQGTLTIKQAQGELVQGADYQVDRTVTFGDAAFSLDVTANHTESKIQYQVTDEKDADGKAIPADGGHILSVSADGMVTIKGAGSAKIQISLPESKNYTAATSLTVTVTIARRDFGVPEQSRSYLYDRESTDTIDLAALLPEDCGSAAYSIISDTIGTDSGVFETAPVIQDGKLSYKVKSGTIGTSGTITVKVTIDNYTINGNAGGVITVKAALVNRKPVEASGTVSVENPTLTYGEPVSRLKFTPVTFVEPETKKTVAGTLRWNTPDEKLFVGAQSVEWTFTPDNDEYQIVTGSLPITVLQAVPKVKTAPVPGAYVYHPTNTLRSEEAKSLLNAGAKVQGVVTDAQGNAVDGSWSWKETEVPSAGTHTYTAVFTPKDAANYETVEKPVTLTVEKAYVSIKDTKAGLTIPTYKHGEYLYNHELPDTGEACYAGKGEDYNTDVVSGIKVSGKYVWAAPETQVKYSDGVSYTTGRTAQYEVEFIPNDTTNYAGTMETKNGWSSQKKVNVTLEKADNPPYRPSAQMTVASTCQTVSDVKLPKDWNWHDNADTSLDNSPVIATAEYTGPYADCYKNTIYPITITRSTCDHARTKVENAKPATCISEGSTGETWCTECKEKLDDGCVLAKDVTNHEALTETVVRVATASQTGLKVQECSACHYRKEVTIPKLSDGSSSQGGGSAQQPEAPDGNGQNTAGGNSDGSGDSSTSGGNGGGQSTTPAQEKGKTQTPAQQPADRGNAAEPANTNRNSAERTTDERSPETGEPFIKGENGKEGWDVIHDELETAGEGETVRVDMNGATTVPGEILANISGKDITLVLYMGDGITWSINGKSFTKENPGDIDFGVTYGEQAGKTIPVDVINNVTGERYSMNLTLAYDGEFGFSAVLSINMDSSNAGLYANLFYYNPESGELEFMCAGQIGEDGSVGLTFTHASDYTIVIDTEPMDLADASDAVDTEDAVQNQEAEDAGAMTEAAQDKTDKNNGWLFLLAAIAAVAAATGVVVLQKRRKQQ